jgi:hypothetical protein
VGRLQKQRGDDGAETLSELDKLYIVHVTHSRAKEQWDSGGPILPRLSTALEKYPHTIVELEVRLHADTHSSFANVWVAGKVPSPTVVRIHGAGRV